MHQLEMHDYVVADAETVNVRVDGLSAEPEVRINVALDGDPLPSDKMEFEFSVSDGRPEHKLLMEFMPITKSDINLMVLLSGSDGGQFAVPIELAAGLTQTRYFRFSVEGRRAFSLGVGES